MSKKRSGGHKAGPHTTLAERLAGIRRLIESGKPEQARQALQNIQPNQINNDGPVNDFMYSCLVLEDWRRLDALYSSTPGNPMACLYKGISEIDRENYADAEKYLSAPQPVAHNEALRLWWLSEAVGQTKRAYEIKDAATRQKCMEFLSAAYAIKGCQYCMLKKLLEFQDWRDVQKRHDLLSLGLENCIDRKMLRLALSQCLLYRGAEITTKHEILEVLDPLLDENLPEARYLAFEHLFKRDELETALYHLERIAPSAFADSLARTALIGLCLLRSGQIDKARTTLSAALSQADGHHASYQGIVRVLLAQVQKESDCIDEALSYLERGLYDLVKDLADGGEPPVRIGEELFHPPYLDDLDGLCKWALQLKQTKAKSHRELKALLLYHKYYTEPAYDERQDSWERNEDYLLQANKTAELPIFYSDMAEYWSQRVNSQHNELHFRLGEALYRKITEPESASSWQDACTIDLREDEAVSKNIARESVAVTKRFVEANMAVSEKDLRAILPLMYEKAITPILKRAEAYEHILDIYLFLRRHDLLPTESSFDTAYAAHMAGNIQLAEELYKQILTGREDSAAWHNLSLISENRKRPDIALE